MILFFSGCAANVSEIPLQKEGGTMKVSHLRSETNVLAFSSDGRHALLSGPNGPTGTLYLWDFKDNRILSTSISEVNLVSLSTFSPDNRFLLTASSDGILKLWDTNTGKHIRTFEYSSDIPVIKKSLTRKFFEKSKEYIKQISPLSNNSSSIKSINKSPDSINSIAFSNSGEYIVTSGYSVYRKYVIRIWNVATGKEIKAHYLDYNGSIMSAVFSHDDQDIISNECNYTFYIIRHNILSGEYSEIRNNASVIAKSINGSFLLTELSSSSSKNNTFVWDAKNEKLQYLRKDDKSNDIIASFSKDGRYVLMWINQNSSLSLYDENLGSKVLDFNMDGKIFNIYNLAISSDNRYAYSCLNNTITVWDTSTGKDISTAYFFDSGDWIVMTPKGYYDSSDKGDHHLQIRIGNRDYSIMQFRKSFYRPDLVKAALAGMSLNSYPSISDLKAPPN